MSDSLVEKVARAISGVMVPGFPDIAEEFTAEASAAIICILAAIAEPSEAMIEGARSAWNIGENVDRWLSLTDLKTIVDGSHSAMIAALRKEVE